MSIQRWHPADDYIYENHDCRSFCEPKDDGDYVKYDDHMKICIEQEKELIRAEKRIEELETHLKIARGGWRSNDDEHYKPEHVIKAEGIREMADKLDLIGGHSPHATSSTAGELVRQYADKLEKGE